MGSAWEGGTACLVTNEQRCTFKETHITSNAPTCPAQVYPSPWRLGKGFGTGLSALEKLYQLFLQSTCLVMLSSSDARAGRLEKLQPCLTLRSIKAVKRQPRARPCAVGHGLGLPAFDIQAKQGEQCQ
uniref:Uncharacterized protein n=1 Tax=Myotis myotis TaxID=51298 RepID=A0A7J7R955_MYOMY|nr:hypothetical protein mMyoMyo1_010870 [Myotis myotis]